MPEWLAVTGAISAVAVAAGVVSGPTIFANVPVAVSLPDSPVLITPGGKAPVSVPSLVPVSVPPVSPSLAPVVSPPALRTGPGIYVSVPPDSVPGSQVPTVTTMAVPPDPCAIIGLTLDSILGLCV